MYNKNFRYNYKKIPECVEAVNWLVETKPYLFRDENLNFRTFRDYLNGLSIKFHSSHFLNDDKDATLSKSFRIVLVNLKKWEQREFGINSAIMVHEVTEGYLLYSDHVFFPQRGHVVAEYFESDFRREKGLPSCTTCPLPSMIIRKMRKFEIELKKRIEHMKCHYDFAYLLAQYVGLNDAYS